MSDAATCPQISELEKFLLGLLAAADAERTQLHVASCRSCLDTLHGLDSSDTLVEAMRGQVRVAERSEDAIVAELIARLDGLQPLANEPDATVDDPVRERPGAAIGPYRLVEEIGEGGFGIVFLAEQQEPIRRQVALKILKPGMDTRRVIARFEAERQALAVMDHANIAKVLDAGATESGRPYFVMELVRGVPITAYCDEHHLPVCERLALFASVCQAIQHAHTKGIIHRDIKPTNVLAAQQDGHPLVKVIDFGIAKAMGPQPTDKTPFTGFAQMIGTPLYMSPEQAGQSGVDIDTRTDIFSLGVLLYELLTGTTPIEKGRFKQTPPDEARRILRDEEPERPSLRLARIRRVGCAHQRSSAGGGHSPPYTPAQRLAELDWIVMKCLEKDRSRRYETVSGLALDVQRYLADEPVLACPPSAGYRLGKFARRNKTGLAITALILLFVVLLGGGAGWLVRDREAQRAAFARDQEARRAKLAVEIQLALSEAETLGDRALALVDDNPHKWEATLTAALAACRRTDILAKPNRLALNPALLDRLSALNERLQADEQDRQFVARIDAIRMEASQVDLERSQFNTAQQSLKIKALLQTRGIEFGATSPEQVVAWIHKRPEPIRKHVIAAFDLSLVRLAGAAAIPADERQWLTAVFQAADADPWRTQARRALLAGDAMALESLAREVQHARQPAAFLLLLASRLPRESEPTKLSLLKQIQSADPGDFWANQDCALALQHADPPQWDAAVRFYTAAVALRPENPGALLNLGHALSKSGDLDGALAAYRKALELAPNYAAAYDNLGITLRAKGDVAGAIAAYREAIRLDSKDAQPHTNLGNALKAQGDLAGAIAAYREAIRLDPKYAFAHNNLGTVLQAQGDLDGAIAEFREAIRLDSKDAHPHHNLGSALRDQGDPDGAIAAYRQAIRLDPQDAQRHNSLGAILCDVKRDYEGAIACFKKAIELDPNLAVAYGNLGNALQGKGEVDAAIAAYREAIRLDPKLATPHNDLASAHQAKGDVDAAIAAYREAIRLEPKLAGTHNELGNALRAKGDVEGAIAAYREAIRLDPKFAFPHNGLGNALQDKSDLEGAIAAYRAAIRLDSKDARPHSNLGNALKAQGDVDGAIAAFRQAIRLDPQNAQRHNRLGVILCDVKRDYEGAIACFKKAIELDPKVASPHFNLGNAFGAKGDVDGAIAAYREAIRLDPKPAPPHYNLGIALSKQKKFADAIACYEKAIELDPKHVNSHNNLAWLLATCSDAKLRDPNRALALAKRAVQLDPKKGVYWQALGYAEYRAGNWQAAITALEKVKELGSPGGSREWFPLAMAHWQLGDKEQARVWYDRAVEWMDKNQPQNEELLRFRAEATDLLRGD